MVVGLLWVVALLNYMDRQMLSTMQVAIGHTITPLQDPATFGWVMSIFLWIYGFMSPVSGIIADRLNRKWLIVGSLGVWSAVTSLMGMCGPDDYNWFVALRALMGVSEALYIPAALSLIADYFTGGARSLAVGVHMTGLYMGQALGGFGATIAHKISWQDTFHWFGIIGIAYAVILILLLHDKGRSKAEQAAIKKAEKLESETVWRSLGMILTNIAFWVILFFFAAISLPGWATKNWLPTLFSDSLGQPLEIAGPIATISIAVSSFIGVMVGGPLSDRWVKRNLKGRVYTSAIGIAMMIPALVLMGFGHNIVAAVCAALFFGLGYGMYDANNMPILCQFVPARQRGTAYGFMNTCGVIAGALTTMALGAIAQSYGLGFGFVVMAGVLVVALILQLTMLNPKTDNMESDSSDAPEAAPATKQNLAKA